MEHRTAPYVGQKVLSEARPGPGGASGREGCSARGTPLGKLRFMQHLTPQEPTELFPERPSAPATTRSIAVGDRWRALFLSPFCYAMGRGDGPRVAGRLCDGQFHGERSCRGGLRAG